MKNFIIPIDFSKESLSGLDMAVLFSKKKTVNIQMVNVITSVSDNLQSTRKESEKSAEKKRHENDVVNQKDVKEEHLRQGKILTTKL